MPPASTTKQIKRGHNVLIYSAAAVIALFIVGLLGSYFLTLNSVHDERIAREQQRAPACVLAAHLIAKESGQARTADTALYRATGCPAVLKAVQ